MNPAKDSNDGNAGVALRSRSRWYALALGAAFLGIGIAGFYVVFPFDLKLRTPHNAIHLVAGALGVLMFRRSTAYVKWVGIIGTVLSLAGLAGLASLVGLIDLSTYFTYLYGAAGITSLLAYLDDKNRR